MRNMFGSVISGAALFLILQCAAHAAVDLPGTPANLTAAEKLNIEKFLDHFNWGGVREYIHGIPRLSSAIWDIWMHQPKLVAKARTKEGERLSISEQLAASNVLKLYGFPLNEQDMTPGYDLDHGHFYFSDGDGPTDGKTKVDKVYKLDDGHLLVRGNVHISDPADNSREMPFLAIISPNSKNGEEGYALQKQILID